MCLNAFANTCLPFWRHSDELCSGMINHASKANRILKSGTFQPDSERIPPKVSQPVRTATQPFHTVKTGGSNPAKSATESRSNFRWISDNRWCRGSKSRNHDKTTNRRNAHEIKDCRACGSNCKRLVGLAGFEPTKGNLAL